MQGCEGCVHFNCCTFFDKGEYDKSEKKRFEDNCCGCACGDGLECDWTVRDLYGACDNYERGDE